MRSKVQVRGRPLHPLLIPFPLALLVGAFAADVGGTLLDVPGLWIAAYYLSIAGVVMGVVAAVPGVIDYLSVMPSRSSARSRATKHMLVNVAAVLLFALAWWVRGAPEIPPDPATLLVEGIAVVLLGVGAWVGRTLTYRNPIDGQVRPVVEKVLK